MKFHRSTAALGAAFVIAAAAVAPAFAMDKKGGMMMAAQKQVTVTLSALNASGETGKAVLKDTKGGVSVMLTLTGGAAGMAQPAHIHMGTCAKLDPKPTYPLTNVVAGGSKTTIAGVTVAKLMAKPMAINVHKSAKELPTYVACGDITGKKTMKM